MTNLEYFTISAEHPEPTIDPFYNKGVMVIPSTASESNLLTERNARLLELVSAFHVLDAKNADPNNLQIRAILDEVRSILDETPNINFSAFTQFFMVYNFAYSSYLTLGGDEKISFLKEILRHYCEERHPVYLSHGYSNSILQVMSDNYSHKRNSKASINKMLAMLEPLGFGKLTEPVFIDDGKVYFLPDKGDRDLFNAFRQRYSVAMRSAATEQGKLPDMVFSVDGEWFIVEMKNIKGSGGGQDKQMTEVINFVRYSEKNPSIHYLVFLDGEYANRLFAHQSPKIQRQFEDVSACLKKNPKNYFVNTAGFRKLLSDISSIRVK